MPTPLSYGFIKHLAGDKGNVWMTNQEANIQKTNDHNHDGSNSALLAPGALAKPNNAVPSGSWVSDGNGNYSQTVTVPGTITEINNFAVFFYDASGHRYDLSIERLTATTYKLYTNDNTLQLTAKYL